MQLKEKHGMILMKETEREWYIKGYRRFVEYLSSVFESG